MKKTLSNTSIRAIAISLLFLISGIGASILITPVSAAPNTPTAAATPLTAAQANWAYPNGNSFNQNYNPQNVVNSSNAQYLGLQWLFPLPAKPAALASLAAAGVGSTMPPLIANGTAFITTQSQQVFALNVATGAVIWQNAVNLLPNSTAGMHSGTVTLHMHDGNEAYTTALFNHTPAYWIQGADNKAYAFNALTGAILLNFTDYTGLSMVPGNNPVSIYNGVSTSNLLIDQTHGIVITSHDAESISANGRCYYAGWNINVNPPTLAWVNECTPPQPGSNVPVNPNWSAQSVNGMQSATTFWAGKNPGCVSAATCTGWFNAAETAGGVLYNTNNQLVVDWKSLTPTVLNQTLYNDWGQANQSPQCLAITGGASTGSTGAGWGGPLLLGTGATAGMAFVNTNNKDPFEGPCNPGPDLWSASVLALNVTTGAWIWGFQSSAHDLWDYDCSWWQALTNETISGVSTQVILKTCKSGYLYEINAKTGSLIWAWIPPTSIVPRGPANYNWNPLNATQTSQEFVGCAPFAAVCNNYISYPATAGFEDEQAYSPATNLVYAASELTPSNTHYVTLNSTNYFTINGYAGTPLTHVGACATCKPSNNNSTIWGVDASTGQVVWHYFIPLQGIRGGVSTSGNLVFVTLSSGDLLMLNAQTGALVRDYYVGAPMDVLPSIGASASGTVTILQNVGTCGGGAVLTCPGTVPGDVIALTLQNVPTGSGGVTTTTATATTTAISTTTVAGGTTTITAGGTTSTVTVGAGQTATVTVGGSTVTMTGAGTTATVTASGTSSGVSSTTLYGVAAVAVIFIIATGYLAMRGRKPAS